MCVGYIDSLMLSGYSELAVGATGNANQIIQTLTLSFTIISSASGIITAQYLGANNKSELNKIYTVTIFFNLFLSSITTIIIFLFSDTIISFMNVPLEMVEYTKSYMLIVCGFLSVPAVVEGLSQIFRSNSKTKIGMFVSLGINLSNIFGNYLVLYGPLKYLNLGIKGVAISTVTSQILALVIMIIYFCRYIDGSISLKYLSPFPFKTFKKLLRVGIPSAGENISYNLSQIVVTMMINTLGIVAVNTKIYTTVIISFSYLFTIAVAVATQIIVGQAIGANNTDFAYSRVRKTHKTALIIAIIISSINFLLSKFTLSLFTDNAEIINLGSKIMFLAIFLEIGRTTNLIVINSLRAAGDIKFPTILGIIVMWLTSVFLGYILGIYFKLGYIGIFLAMILDEVIRGVAVIIRWEKGKWRNKKLV